MSDAHAVSSVGCASGALLDAVADFDDLAFLQLVLGMQESDAELRAKLEEVRATNAHKQELLSEIDRLSRALAAGNAKNDMDFVYVSDGLDGHRTEPDVSSDMQRWIDKLSDQSLLEFLEDTNSQTYKLDNGLEVDRGVLEREANSRGYYRKKSVQGRIDGLRSELEQLSTAQEVAMIDLNRLINKRAEAVQMTSNILAKGHQTALALIANLK